MLMVGAFGHAAEAQPELQGAAAMPAVVRYYEREVIADVPQTPQRAWRPSEGQLWDRRGRSSSWRWSGAPWPRRFVDRDGYAYAQRRTRGWQPRYRDADVYGWAPRSYRTYDWRPDRSYGRGMWRAERTWRDARHAD